MCVACAPACTIAHSNTHPCPKGCDHEQEFEQSGNSEHFGVSSCHGDGDATWVPSGAIHF